MLTAFLATPTIVGLVGLWSGAMLLPCGTLEIRIYLTILALAVFVAYFIGTIFSKAATVIGGTSSEHSDQSSPNSIILVLSLICVILFIVRLGYFIKSGGAALYTSSDALGEARLQLLEEAGVSGPIGRVYTLFSWAQFVLPVGVVLYWNQLTKPMKLLAAFSSLLWPLLAVLSLGRLNVFIVAYIFLVFPLNSGSVSVFRMRPIITRLSIVAFLVVGLFVAGAIREFSGDTRQDRIAIKQNAYEKFDSNLVAIIHFIPLEAARLGAAQLLDYSLSPWYYGATMLSKSRRVTPFTRSFYFLSWPAVALGQYPEIAVRREAEFRIRESRGVPLTTWTTSIYDYVADFGMIFGSVFQIMIGFLAGVFSNRTDSGLFRSSFSCCLELAVFSLPTFSIFIITPIEATIYISIIYIITRICRRNH
ncbi:MAG: hypothetical protein IPP19_12880 [Verrucomicrobia bacterium]|nr:hypothetical protein [Verrucomicrobiota bacterium]